MKISQRQGFSFVEMLVAVTVLTVLLGILGQVLGVVAAQRRASARRLTAEEEVANAMERLAAIEYAQLQPARAKEIQLSDHARQSLPQAALTVEITAEDAQPPAKRVTVELVWQNRAGQSNRPIRLTAWRYAAE